MNKQNYLDFLKMDPFKAPDRSYLKRLHERHLFTVPFENLDVRRGIHINLDLEYLYNKVVVQKRGGLCYEINRLFAWLLEKLGYQVKICSSGVYDAATNKFGPEYDHMVLCVYLEETYLVDVAFGDCFRSPVSLTNTYQTDISSTYRIVPSDTGKEFYELQRIEAGKWLPVYRFSTQNHQVSDFKDMALHVSSSEESYHTKHSICSIATEIGRVTLSDDHLTRTEKGQKIKQEINSRTQFHKELYTYFGIDHRKWNAI